MGWDLVLRRLLNDCEVERVAEILGMLGGVNIIANATDRMLWKHSKDGFFSVNSAYRRGLQHFKSELDNARTYVKGVEELGLETPTILAFIDIVSFWHFAQIRLDAAVLDLVADDKNGLQKQKVSYHWDKRSKKYIKLNNGDRVTASGKIKTESGSKGKTNKTGIYKKWKDQSHKRVSLNGTNDGNSAAQSTSLAGGPRGQDGGRNFRGGRNNRSVPNAHVRSEIKDVDQVRKEREKKAQRASYLKTKKGKKAYKGGKKGKGNGKGKGKGRQG
ncbi:hypothetical protein MTR67_042529 [Solanum verrucosum]|uniref:DBP10 C-terminal domain-containing protein n=1 Tax=Solanum verrucosum TaxID=315347 RepID=A0AAF0ZU78_SOLVR|nr:hypothetical protein MTR67_042529 [Solanum verrucosum]